MSQYEKLLLAILSGTKDKNLLFSDLRLVLERLEFQCRVKGDHFIYTKTGVDEIINIQPAGTISSKTGSRSDFEVPVRGRCA